MQPDLDHTATCPDPPEHCADCSAMLEQEALTLTDEEADDLILSLLVVEAVEERAEFDLGGEAGGA